MSPMVAVNKRAMDLGISIIAMIVFLPLFVIIPAVIRQDSEGPPFFVQERVGLNGRPIKMIKFRTMRQDAEKGTGPVWATDNDHRITRVGRFLRMTRLDELPQLINVFLGEMSLVGPRPERPFFVDQLHQAIPFYDERVFSVKPGITGLAQINEEYDTSIDSVRQKLLYDHAYGASLTRFKSFLITDMTILGKTIQTVVTGKGAH